VVGGLKREFGEHGAGISVVLMTERAFCDWLVNHIKKTDTAMAAYLRDQGGNSRSSASGRST
jgi:hemerythrin